MQNLVELTRDELIDDPSIGVQKTGTSWSFKLYGSEKTNRIQQENSFVYEGQTYRIIMLGPSTTTTEGEMVNFYCVAETSQNLNK